LISSRLVRKAGNALLITLVCLIAFEATTRIDDWVRFGTSPWSPISVEEDLLVSDSLGEHGKPYAQYQKWSLNNVGMRGRDVIVPKPPGVLRIVTAGASETFGLYESPGREYPRQLEDSLRSVLGRECDGVRIEVVNAAIFGMSLPSVDQDLRMRVAPLHPDVVVYYPTPVQYLAESVPRPADPVDPGIRTAEPWFAVLRPRSLNALREQLKEVLPSWLKGWLRQEDLNSAVAGRSQDWRFTTVPDDRLVRYDRDLRHIIGTIRAIGAEPVIMTHANHFMARRPGDDDEVATELTAWQLSYPRATGAVLIAFDSDAVAPTLRAALDSGVQAVDLATAMRTASKQDTSKLFGDYSHFTDAGSALVAHTLTPAVVRTLHEHSACHRDNGVITTVNRVERSP
jgi:hypothetical protein